MLTEPHSLTAATFNFTTTDYSQNSGKIPHDQYTGTGIHQPSEKLTPEAATEMPLPYTSYDC